MRPDHVVSFKKNGTKMRRSPNSLRIILCHERPQSVLGCEGRPCINVTALPALGIKWRAWIPRFTLVALRKRSFDATTRPTTGSHRIPLCRLCEKLISEIKMPDRRRIDCGLTHSKADDVGGIQRRLNAH